MIANLLDNSINAIKKLKKKKEKRIIARLWSTESGSGLSIEDNGIPFKANILEDLERCKETLIHDREKGCGIGFALMLEITKCKASLFITDKPGFKVVTVKFNYKNELIIDKYEKPDRAEFGAEKKIIMSEKKQKH